MALFPEGRRSLTAWAYQIGPGRMYQPAYRFIVADIGLDRGAWLDIGAGPGWLGIHAAAGHPELDVIGIDISETMVSIANANKGPRLNVNFRKMDGAGIVYPAGTFDVVTAVQSAHHWTDPGPILAEAWRVMVPGGRLLIYEADPDGEIPSQWIQRLGPGGLWPPDAVLRRRWRRYGMDADRWGALVAQVRASPFGDDLTDERHGFYRRLVCTR